MNEAVSSRAGQYEVHEDVGMEGTGVGEALEPVRGLRGVGAHDAGCCPEEPQALAGLMKVH